VHCPLLIRVDVSALLHELAGESHRVRRFTDGTKVNGKYPLYRDLPVHKDFKSAFSINYTEINYRFCRTNVLIDGCAQRWLFPATLQTQSGSLTLSLASLIVNQTNEIAIGLDKKLDNTTFLNGDEVMLSGSTFDEFLDEGGTSSPTLKGLLLKIDIFELFSKNLG
jgi:hypothetical protein